MGQVQSIHQEIEISRPIDEVRAVVCVSVALASQNIELSLLTNWCATTSSLTLTRIPSGKSIGLWSQSTLASLPESWNQATNSRLYIGEALSIVLWWSVFLYNRNSSANSSLRQYIHVRHSSNCFNRAGKLVRVFSDSRIHESLPQRPPPSIFQTERGDARWDETDPPRRLHWSCIIRTALGNRREKGPWLYFWRI